MAIRVLHSRLVSKFKIGVNVFSPSVREVNLSTLFLVVIVSFLSMRLVTLLGLTLFSSPQVESCLSLSQKVRIYAHHVCRFCIYPSPITSLWRIPHWKDTACAYHERRRPAPTGARRCIREGTPAWPPRLYIFVPETHCCFSLGRVHRH